MGQWLQIDSPSSKHDLPLLLFCLSLKTVSLFFQGHLKKVCNFSICHLLIAGAQSESCSSCWNITASCCYLPAVPSLYGRGPFSLSSLSNRRNACAWPRASSYGKSLIVWLHNSVVSLLPCCRAITEFGKVEEEEKGTLIAVADTCLHFTWEEKEGSFINQLTTPPVHTVAVWLGHFLRMQSLYNCNDYWHTQIGTPRKGCGRLWISVSAKLADLSSNARQCIMFIIWTSEIQH